MVKNIFLCESLRVTGGIESFEYNIGKHFKNDNNVEIEFWFYDATPAMLEIFEPLGKCVKWDKKSIIECDNLFFPSRCIGTIIGKVKAKNVIECFHMAADLGWNTYTHPMVTKCIAVSQAACDVWKRANGRDCECYYPIVDIDKDKLTETKIDDGVLKLITCARLNTADKGAKRMKVIADRLNERGIDYKWTICGESNGSFDDPHFQYLGKLYNKETIYNEVVKNDFAVQLSDCEGFGMAISEALNLNVPIVCTPISVLSEHKITKDNCIISAFDGSNVDEVIDRMLNEKFEFTYAPPQAGDWKALLYGE